jgi:Lon protease-like protein
VVELSATIPIFPLSGVLLLPRGLLPLNIFEPRYITMVDDALSSDRLIGMVQPMDERSAGPSPRVYPTGCAGRISSFDETDDGRYLITLTGLCRFRLDTELPIERGYRRVRADWQPFSGDLLEEPDPGLDRNRLLGKLGDYLDRHGMAANWDAIKQASDERLITSLAMICPFEACEKQALLEAGTLAERATMLTTLIEMAVLAPEADDSARH